MKIVSPADAYRFFKKHACAEVEEFWVAALNSEKDVLQAGCLFRGTVDLCLFHPRDVFRFAYRHNASSVVVAHNHPSGNALPSAEDRVVTRQLIGASIILQVPVVDHVILAGGDYFSFLGSGELKILAADLWPSDQSPG